MKTSLKSLMKYLKRENDSLKYIGSTPMKVTLPSFYQDRDFIIYDGESIQFLGIAKISINDQDGVIIIPAMLSTLPSDIEETKDEFILHYNQNDIFVKNVFIIQNTIDLYKIFTSFVTLGKKIPFLEYRNLSDIFSNLEEIKGITLNARRTCFELIFSEIARSKNDLSVNYRNTPMTDEYELISMRNVMYGPKSVTSKLLGNYFNDAIVSVLLDDDSSSPNTIENYLKS